MHMPRVQAIEASQGPHKLKSKDHLRGKYIESKSTDNPRSFLFPAGTLESLLHIFVSSIHCDYSDCSDYTWKSWRGWVMDHWHTSYNWTNSVRISHWRLRAHPARTQWISKKWCTLCWVGSQYAPMSMTKARVPQTPPLAGNSNLNPVGSLLMFIVFVIIKDFFETYGIAWKFANNSLKLIHQLIIMFLMKIAIRGVLPNVETHL